MNKKICIVFVSVSFGHECVLILMNGFKNDQTVHSYITGYIVVKTSFAIIHLDLWMPGHHTDNNGNMAFMNAMCDMSQFVVVVPIADESSAILAS